MAIIFIQQLKVETIIGVYDFERKNKQTVLLDIELQYDATQAMASDNLKYALDYHKISIQLHEYIANSSFQLIETMADKVCDLLLDYTQIEKVKLTINKPNAMEQVKNVGIYVNRTQNAN